MEPFEESIKKIDEPKEKKNEKAQKPSDGGVALPVIKNKVNESKNVRAKSVKFSTDTLPNLPGVPIAPPLPPNFLEAPNNGKTKKKLVESNPSLEDEKAETIEVKFSTSIKYTDYLPLMSIQSHLNSIKSSHKKVFVKTLTFNGIEPLTDMALYVIYLFFYDDPIWKNLMYANFDSCRYITDFGVELLYEATGKNSLTRPHKCSGCTKMFKTLWSTKKAKDIFLNSTFVKTLDNAEETFFKTFKFLIINTSEFNVIKFLKNGDITKRSSRFIFEYERIKIQPIYNYDFNVIECSENSPLSLYSQSSLIAICINYQNDSLEVAANKILSVLNCNLDYIWFNIMLLTSGEKISDKEYKDKIWEILDKKLTYLSEEETRIKSLLEKMNFQEQETNRDILRLKFSLSRFLSNKKNLYVSIIDKTNTDHLAYAEHLGKILYSRTKANVYVDLENLIKQKKFERKIFKIEELIDEILNNEEYSFKTLMQTRAYLSTLGEDFIDFKSLLGECLTVKVDSGQSYAIFDLKWFSDLVQCLTDDLSEKLIYDKNSNIAYWNYDDLKETDNLNKLGLSDVQQLEYLVEILKKLFLIFKTEKEREDSARIILPITNSQNEKQLTILWPNELEDCLEINSRYDLYYKAPKSFINELMSAFMQLPFISFFSETCIIGNEGFFNFRLQFSNNYQRLELSLRALNKFEISVNSFKKLKKSLLCLFNEYRLIVEAIFLDRSIPYKYSDECKKGFKLHSAMLETNFDDPLILSINKSSDQYFVAGHNFISSSKYKVNLTYNKEIVSKCSMCNLNINWFRLVYNSFRKINPVFHSELLWRLNLTISGQVMRSIDPERKAILSIFESSLELVTFNGTQELNVHDFNSFKTTFTALMNASVLKIGAEIIQKNLNKKYIVFLNAITKRITVLEDDIIYNASNKNSKNRFEYKKTIASTAVISVRTQRYLKGFNSKRKPIKISKVQQSNKGGVDSRLTLMDEIRQFKFSAANDDEDTEKVAAAENWIVKASDSVTVVLTQKELNTCEFAFFYNNEKIGFWVIEHWDECIARPYAETQGDNIRIFFDMNMTAIKSLIANDFSFKVGMHLEAEDPESDSNKICAATIDDVNRQTGQLCVDIDSKKYWMDPWSPKLHPCGYSVYMKNEKLKGDPFYKDFKNALSWDWISRSPKNIPAPLDLFTEEQHQGLLISINRNKYFPDSQPFESILTCDYVNYPRNIWNIITQLNQNDLNEIFTDIGALSLSDDVSKIKQDFSVPPALVILPKADKDDQMNNQTLNCLTKELTLNISCLHREEIKLQGEQANSIITCYSHLLHGDSFNITAKRQVFSDKIFLMLLCTSLDFANSKQIDYSAMKSYFRQLSFMYALMIPQLSEIKYRINTSSFKKFIVDDFVKLAGKTEKNQIDEELENFIAKQAKKFGIDESGSCKYCNTLNINLSTDEASKEKINNIEDLIKSCGDYKKIVAKICLKETPYHMSAIDNLSMTINSSPLANNIINTIKRTPISLTKELFESFPNLNSIILSGIEVKTIDESIKQCNSLKNLELTDNNLSSLPSSLDFSSIIQIIIENNPIETIPETLLCNRSLRSMVLSKLNIRSLPDNWINDDVEAVDIRYLTISQTRLNKLPNDLIAGNSRMEQFTFQGVNLIIPESEQNWPTMLVSLETLIATFCPTLFSVDEMTTIFRKYDYDKNKVLNFKEIQDLNAFIFRKFERLGDHLSRAEEDPYGGIPPSLFKCTFLTYLDLSFQAIRKIPDAIESLKSLKTLKLRYCVLLEALSASVGFLPLNQLDIIGCLSLKTPPKEIQRRGVTSILAYLKRLRSGSVNCKRTKLMLVGLGGAGKTSLVRSLVDSVYQTHSNTPVVTDGITIRDWSVPLNDDTKSNLVFSVWDFAGQTVYYNTHQFFLTNRSIYLLVWNCRLGAEHAGLEFWLNSITCHAPGAPIFIVGTHVDQVSKFEIPAVMLKKRYPCIVGFHYVSCFDGKNMNELSVDIVRSALAEKYMGEKIPECWLQFEEALKGLKDEKNLIEYEDIVPLAMNYGIFDRNELVQAIQFLHDLGSLLHFNNEFLKNKIVINPQYIVDVMACLVSIKNNFIDEGKLYHKDVGEVWKRYDVSLHKWILKLTEKFDLTFNVANKDFNLVPCLMPDVAPEGFNWPSIELGLGNSQKKEIIILYHFEYLPAGLFNRAQVRLFQISENTSMWKNGSVLKKSKNHIALIQKKENMIELKVQGVQPENLLFLIHEVLECLISESFNGVRYDFSFPCPDCIDTNAIDVQKSMFNASLVRRASEMKAAFLQCRQHFHAVSLVDLHARFPPDTIDNYDLQLRYSIRDLKQLKNRLLHDLILIYSANDAENTAIIHPRVIKADLENSGYTCWFTETPHEMRPESLALVLRNTSLILFCMSDNFVEDKHCKEAFHYVKNILAKPYLLIALGESFEWQKSAIGALVSHEYFVKVNTIERYKHKLPLLLEQITKKISLSQLAKNQSHAQVFLSYCHSNSHEAVSKGAPLKSEHSLGWADPRTIKTFLENEGYSVWVDYEQLGSKQTLFEDIVDGIQNCKMMIACVSNDYARSDACMKEFRFATNLKIPILICIFGSQHAKAEWRNTELGMLSCLNQKEINFQIENPYAYQEIVKELYSENIVPVKSASITTSSLHNRGEDDAYSQMESAYNELFEVTQRKFLRQLANFSDFNSKPFPRLFVIDIVADNQLDAILNFQEPISSENFLSTTLSTPARSPMRNRLTRNESLDVQKTQRVCLKALCEHEGGWHVVGAPIPYGTVKQMHEGHFAYFLRMMTLVKHSHFLSLELMNQPEIFDDILKYIDDKLASIVNANANPGPQYMGYAPTPSRFNQTIPKDLKESFNLLRNFVERSIGRKNVPIRREENYNYVESFDLSRCSLPSGKILWLCSEHRRDENIEILNSGYNANAAQYQNEEYNAALLDLIKKPRNENDSISFAYGQIQNQNYNLFSTI